MQIGLDYDDTYTRDPATWNAVISLLRQAGHKVYVVTWRFPDECTPVHMNLSGYVDGIYPTSRKAKEKFMFAQGICIDVWIDDNPRAVLHTMEGHA